MMETPPPRLHVDASDTYCLASKGELPGVCLMAADNALFGIYQDWVHQNTDIHLDGGIDEDGKWQARLKPCLFSHPNLRCIICMGLKKVCLESRGRA